jgi:hypothetical protein
LLHNAADLAAVGEHLARCCHLQIPDWAETRWLDLEDLFSAGWLESLKVRLFVDSPTTFRPRMLFVSKDVICQQRRGVQAPGGHSNRVRRAVDVDVVQTPGVL